MEGFLRRIQRAGYLLPTGLTGYLLVKGIHPGLPGLACPLRALTGIPCPTCFLTRATAATLRGDWAGAISLHAFGPLAATGLVLWSLVAIRQRSLLPRGLRGWHLVLVASALLAYWAARLVLQYGMGVAAFPPG
jgi:hypothetical protein